MSWENITIEQVKIWEVLYDEVDVVKEIKVNMIRWLDKCKGTKRVQKKNWRTFIINWLARSQAKAIGMI
jgi:hypothetical protein